MTETHFILFYKTVENYLEKRTAYREEHLNIVRTSSENGNLVMAGAFSDSEGGAALVFKGDGPGVAEEFAKNDPYVKNGLIEEWYVRPWAVVVERNS